MYQPDLQLQIDEQCLLAGIPTISVRFVSPDELTRNDGRAGEYNNHRHCISLVRNASRSILRENAFHEFEHYWQYENCRDLFMWWMQKDNYSFYRKSYDTVICNIEEDAFVFGYSFGKRNRRDLLEEYSISLLNRLKSSELEYQKFLERVGCIETRKVRLLGRR